MELKQQGPSSYYEGATGFQAHHMLQKQWANANLGAYGYGQKQAPTISLGTGPMGVDSNGNIIYGPHNTASVAQTERFWNRGGNGNYYSTLNSELAFGATDMLRAGMSEGLVMSELERNYAMIDALNAQNSAKIQSGDLDLLEYDRAAIVKLVHDYSGELERERMLQLNC